MKPETSAIMISDRLAALAEPIRLRVLRLLEAEELSVGEVAKVVQLPQSTVSRHLKVLADAGWVARRPMGPATMYRLVMDDLGVDSRGVWVAIRGRAGELPEAASDTARLAGVLAERRFDSQSFFGRVAGAWDEVRTELFGRDFTARSLLALMPTNWTVADIGCGTGNVAELLAPHVERVIAVDQSEPMLEAARKRLDGGEAAGRETSGGVAGNVSFVQGGLERLPLGEASVDAAVCVLVLHHVPDVGGALKELRRILRPDRGGGVVLIVDMVRHDRADYRQQMGHQHLGFGREELSGLMARAGLRVEGVTPLPMDSQARGPGLFVARGRAAWGDGV